MARITAFLVAYLVFLVTILYAISLRMVHPLSRGRAPVSEKDTKAARKAPWRRGQCRDKVLSRSARAYGACIPYFFITAAAAGVVRCWMNAFAASGSFALAPTAAANTRFWSNCAGTGPA
jgi:hypothetical protein